MKCIIAASLLLAADSARLTKRSQCGQLGGSGSARNETSISIVNGEDAPECKWRWQVGLTKPGREMPFCGGMLIADDWVLTAAHCMVFPADEFQVTAGEWKPKEPNSNRQVRDIAQLWSHPSYSSITTNWDFALLKLASPVNINSCVGTVCLPTQGNDVSNAACWITGWGTLSSGGVQPDVLQEGAVNTLTNAECRATSYLSFQIKDQMLCAQGRTPDGLIVDACQGDSGGPLVCEADGVWTVYGATSWGRGCASRRYPGVWARVHESLDWIDEVMSAN